MITAIDTNILLDILVPNEDFYEGSAHALQDAAGEGSLVISDIVYAELCIHFETQRECDAFLESNEIRVQALAREAHFPREPRVADVSAAGRKANQNPGRLSGRRSCAATSNAFAFAGPGLLPQTVSVA
jgi:predicted nucleic acid-binding protein